MRIGLIGVFDLYHRGHVELLNKAGALGELVVLIVGDKAVRQYKGSTRPIYNIEDRTKLIKSHKKVVKTIEVDKFEVPDAIIKQYCVDFWIIGEDQKHIDFSNIPSNKIIYFPRFKGVSTTDIIKKIKGEV